MIWVYSYLFKGKVQSAGEKKQKQTKTSEKKLREQKNNLNNQ